MIFASGLLGPDASADQSQGRIPVSAFVVVSSTISSTLSASLAPTITAPSSPATAPPATDAGAGHDPGDRATAQQAGDKPNSDRPKTRPLCAAVAVNCSGRAPLRISLGDDAPTDAVQECAAQGASSSVSVCGDTDAGATHVGVNIEY